METIRLLSSTREGDYSLYNTGGWHTATVRWRGRTIYGWGFSPSLALTDLTVRLYGHYYCGRKTKTLLALAVAIAGLSKEK